MTEESEKPDATPPARMKVRRRRYTLEELLEGSEEMRELGETARGWMDSPPVGREIF